MPTDFRYDHKRITDCRTPEGRKSDEDVDSILREWGIEDDFSAAALDDWYQKAHPPVDVSVDVKIEVEDELTVAFERLARQWKEDTWHVSSIRRKISHPSYMKIIGMGEAALPLIFADMRREPSLWFWALAAITREDIAPNSKSMNELHQAWLSWAEANGY